MHLPCDPTRVYLTKLRHQELMREVERERLAGQLPDPGFFAHLASALGPRLRAILVRFSPATFVRRDRGVRSGTPALEA